MKNIAIVSPGLLPIPPIIGGSVETYIQKVSDYMARRFNVDIYGPAHRLLPAKEFRGNITYYRFPAQKYGDYFSAVRAHITTRKSYQVIQVENRPLFIPQTKKMNPQSKYICSLHSLDHINEKLIGRGLTSKIFRLCDGILLYSKFMKNTLAEMFPEVADRIHYIHLAAEIEKFKPRWDPEVKKGSLQLKKSLGIPPKDKVLLFVGRVIPKKGVDILLETMTQVLSRYPSCSLVVVGSNWFGNQVPTAHYRDLQKKAQKLRGKVIFTNYVYPQNLPQYYAMADVFICPSQWNEPFGLVNVEAMASGVPVVASARGGIPEIVKDGAWGYLVHDEKNPHSFVAPIVDLLENPERAEAFGFEGRKKAEGYFNWQRVGQQITELHEAIIRK